VPAPFVDPDEVLAAARFYAGHGLRVIPITPGRKHPPINAWQDAATTDPPIITSWWTGVYRGHGVGIVTGEESGVWVLDVDVAGTKVGAESVTDLELAYGPLPETVEGMTGTGGRHLFFAWDPAHPVRNDQSGRLGRDLDVRGEGGQVLAAPTIHPDTGEPYRLRPGHEPGRIGFAAAPGWLYALLEREPERAGRAVGTSPPSATTATAAGDTFAVAGRFVSGPDDDSPAAAFNASTTWEQLLKRDGWTLARTAGSGEQRWTRPGKTPRDGISATVGHDGRDVLKVFTSSVPALEADAAYSRFGYEAAVHHHGDRSALARHLRAEMNEAFEADREDWSWVAGALEGPGAPDPTLVATAAPGRAPPPTDLGNARRLVTEHGADLRYAPQLGAWLVWDGARWAEDVTGEAPRRAKAVVDRLICAAAGADTPKAQRKAIDHWMRSQHAARLAAMVAVAATEPGVPITIDRLDADPWLLNVANGTLDLRTGTLRPHDRTDLITKASPVPFDPAATAPRWERFLNDVFAGDAEVIAFVARLVGWSITGDVSEQRLPIAYGPGANGKSTFLAAMKAVLGDYATSIDPQLLVASDHAQHPTGLMDLRGARFVATVETEQDRRLAESLVKQLTGGDPISARRMRQDYVTFLPTHKLWLAANHLPRVRGTDHAIWRRLVVVPFLVTFDGARRDPDLGARLAAEAPGILAWALEGCRAWQQQGLAVPAQVEMATADYRGQEDHLGRFLAECCELGDDRSVPAATLRRRYEEWCREQGETLWTAKAVGAELTRRGLDRARSDRRGRWMWLGVDCRPEDERPDATQLKINGAEMPVENQSATLRDRSPLLHVYAGAREGGNGEKGRKGSRPAHTASEIELHSPDVFSSPPAPAADRDDPDGDDGEW
jgi:P4 family phage/plasmid primase-like protien